MLPLTKFAIRESGERMERGIVRFLTVAKAADGSLECVAEVVFGGAPHLLSRGGRDGKPMLGSDANGPCAWTRRAPRMVVAGGDPAVHRPLAVPQGIVASRAPRRVRRTLGEGACEAAKPGNWFRRFLFCGRGRTVTEVTALEVTSGALSLLTGLSRSTAPPQVRAGSATFPATHN